MSQISTTTRSSVSDNKWYITYEEEKVGWRTNQTTQIYRKATQVIGKYRFITTIASSFIHTIRVQRSCKESVEMYKDFDFLRYYMEGTQFKFYGSVHDNEESGVIGDTKRMHLILLVEYLLDSADPEDYGLACDVDIDTLYNIIKDRVYKENGIDVERVFIGDVLTWDRVLC